MAAISGTPGDDTLVGTSDADRIDGFGGNDTLIGGGGADSLYGGTGNDIYVISDPAAFIIEYFGEGTDLVQSSVSYALSGWYVENLTLTGFTAINGIGNQLNNVITGNVGANSLHGGVGADLLYGGDGIDQLFGDEDNDTLYGGEGSDRLTGGGGDDVLYGEAGNDILSADAGNDTLYGGIGNDTYVVSAPGAIIFEYAGEGTDTVETSVSYALSGWYIEGLTLTGFAPINGYGNQLDNVITGNDSGNILHGGSGADTLFGAGGNDTLIADGNDDQLYGGAGDDTFVVDTANVYIVEYAGEGNDTVQSSISYALSGWYIENLTLTGYASNTGIGNQLNNVITGNVGANTLHGAAGADVLYGGDGIDTLYGDEGDDSLFGEEGADTLIGGVGNDSLYGGAGNDRLVADGGDDQLYGGTGNDTYVVSAPGAYIIEFAGEGTDGVETSVSYVLSGWYIEGLTLTGTAAINGTGNQLDNVITGNDAANILHGGTGADTLFGGGGHDTLIAHGNDDALYGGTGSDTYVVDSADTYILEYAGEGTDTVESSVSYALSGWYIENLTLTGTAAIDGTGNQLDNIITGNDAANVLRGGSGADTLFGRGGNDRLIAFGNDDQLYGGAGDDTYVVDTADTYIVEFAGEGTDTVESALSYALSGWYIENLTLTGGEAVNGTGNQLDNVITGNDAANVLSGAAGNDTLIGGGGADLLIGGDGNDDLRGGSGDDILQGDAGQDVLAGGAGADIFRYRAVGDSAFGGADRIDGFESGIDRIDLTLIDANTQTGAHDSFLFIGAQGFTGRAGELRFVQAGSNIDLYGDLNGDSVADLHIRIVGNGLAVGDINGAIANQPSNRAPAITSGSFATLAENSAVSTVVYQTVASDPDGDPVTYRLSGPDSALFSIDSSGAVRLLSPANFEARSSYAFVVHAEDGRGGTTAQPITLNIQNVNEAPVITSGTTATIAENSPTSTVVYQVVASDPDGNALTYTLGGADAASFTIDQNGAVRFIQSPDFEVRSSYSISVNASDGSLVATRGVNVTVTNVNESVSSTPVMQETAAANDSIATAQAIDRGLLAVASNSNLENPALPSIRINGAVSAPGDQDFFSITLQEGELLILDVDGTATGGPTAPGLDSFLRAFGPDGRKITFNDDLEDFDLGSSRHSNVTHNMDSLVIFRAPTSGTYSFSIGSYVGPDGVPSSSGSYILNVSVGPVATRAEIDQENIAALNSEVLWSNPGNLTFSFPVSDTQYPSGEAEEEKVDSFAPLTTLQKDVTRAIFDFASQLSQLRFSELTSSQGSAQIRLAQTDNAETAYAYYPGFGDGGDIWFRNHAPDSDTGSSRYETPVPGNYGYLTFIHEIGHALGLKHGHETPALSPDRNSMEYSVMTYSGYIYADLEDAGYVNETWGFAQSFMMYDIAALQQMYGVNWDTNSGDTTYSWSPITGAFSINGILQWTPGGNRVFQTIWDGGGNDTYDLSSYSNAVTIDLRPGEWTITSQVQLANLGDGNFARGNVANALLFQGDSRSLIENGIGGSGNDTLIANQATNRLTGGAGADTFAWRSAGDAQTTGPDRILDFVRGADKIDLSAIDAIGGTAANDAFSFIGSNAFTGVAGQLRYEVDANGVNVYGDVDGNGVADLHIIVNGTSIAATDFIF